MPDPYLNMDLSRQSDETLVRDLIIARVIVPDLVADGVLEDDAGMAKAIIRELIARGWTTAGIIEQANDAPWVDRALKLIEEAERRDSD